MPQKSDDYFRFEHFQIENNFMHFNLLCESGLLQW